MIKYRFYQQLSALLLLLVFITSCNGQVKTNMSKDNAIEQNTIPIGQPKLIKNHFTNPNQAAADNVHCGLQDKAGNLWFGTTGDGVYRYDGALFTNFTTKSGLNSNTVWSILEDKTGNIWVGTERGICLFDGKTFKNISIPMNNGSNFYTSTSLNAAEKNDVWSIMQDKSGTIWFGTTAGVYCYDGKTFTRFLDNKNIVNNQGLSLKSVQCLLEDKKGNVWFGSGPMAFEGVCLYQGKSLTQFRPQNENWIRNIIEDKNGALLFATRRIGAYIYYGENFAHFSQPKELLNGSFNYILEDKKGHIWYASDYGDNVGDNLGGVWCTDSITNKDGGTTFTKLLSEEVFWLFEDKNGFIWVGTRHTGLYRYDGKRFTKFSEN